MTIMSEALRTITLNAITVIEVFLSSPITLVWWLIPVRDPWIFIKLYISNEWSLLRSKALALTVWVGVPHIHAELAEKAYRSYQKCKFISLSTGRHLLIVKFSSLESNSGIAVTTYNTTERSVPVTEFILPHKTRLQISSS
jgi:hypothetical protein